MVSNLEVVSKEFATPFRLVHLTLASDAGGLSQYVHNLCSAMHARGHFVAVAGDTGAWQGLFDAAPFAYLNVPLKQGLVGFWKSRRAVRRFCAENRIDLIHTHYRRATMLGRTVGLPLLYTLHLSHIDVRGVSRWFTDFGDHTHAASVDARRWLVDEAHVRAERISLIPHGVDVGRFVPPAPGQRAHARRLLGLTDDDLVAVYVGRFDTPKNEEWLLDLARTSIPTLPRLKVLLVGEGPHESALRERAGSPELKGRVMVLSARDPLPVYQCADALLLPSAREGFSLVCAEAMACGVPVFRTRTSGTTELIIEDVTGRSVEIDHDAFVRGAIEFLSQPDALARMGHAALAHVRASYTFDRQVDQTIELYRHLVSRARP